MAGAVSRPSGTRSRNGAFISGSYQNKGVNESLAIQATLPGTYYFRVYGYPVGSGAWSITEGYTLSTSFATGQIVISSQPQSVSGRFKLLANI
jgi:hypothetical protein